MGNGIEDGTTESDEMIHPTVPAAPKAHAVPTASAATIAPAPTNKALETRRVDFLASFGRTKTEAPPAGGNGSSEALQNVVATAFGANAAEVERRLADPGLLADFAETNRVLRSAVRAVKAVIARFRSTDLEADPESLDTAALSAPNIHKICAAVKLAAGDLAKAEDPVPELTLEHLQNQLRRLEQFLTLSEGSDTKSFVNPIQAMTALNDVLVALQTKIKLDSSVEIKSVHLLLVGLLNRCKSTLEHLKDAEAAGQKPDPDAHFEFLEAIYSISTALSATDAILSARIEDMKELAGLIDPQVLRKMKEQLTKELRSLQRQLEKARRARTESRLALIDSQSLAELHDTLQQLLRDDEQITGLLEICSK